MLDALESGDKFLDSSSAADQILQDRSPSPAPVTQVQQIQERPLGADEGQSVRSEGDPLIPGGAFKHQTSGMCQIAHRGISEIPGSILRIAPDDGFAMSYRLSKHLLHLVARIAARGARDR